jgi:glycosyltransferase involved in cell wall biosynthesis
MQNKPFAIAHLITELNMGGAEEMLYKLVTSMDPRRFRCTVISMTDRGSVGEKIVAAGIPLFELGMAPGRPSLSGLYKIYSLLKQESVDILQTWLYHADLLGLITGRLAGVGRVVWGIRCSNMLLRNYRPLTAFTVKMAALLSSRADAIVVNSRKGQDVHERRGYFKERMVFIPNGFDVERFKPDESSRPWLCSQLGLPEDAFIVGLIARYDPMKDQRTFLKAASLLAQKQRSLYFIMAGKGMDENNLELSEIIAKYNLHGRIHLLGLRQDIPKIVSALDTATSSSAFGEGFSNTIGEAMACGVPCVVTDVGDSAYIVGDTGLVVPPRDPEAMAAAWERVFNLGRNERASLGKRARERVQEQFELGKVVKQFENFYERLRKNH